jgi:hypothetical protein
MPTVKLDRPKEEHKAIMEKFGIRLLESISAEAFERVIIDYLDRHNVLSLATCRNGEPRCTTVEYFNDGMTVYLLCEGGGKIANMRANPTVSYTIHDPFDASEDFFGATGLQVWGTADFFKKSDDPDRAEPILARYPYLEGLKEQGLDQALAATNFFVVTIEPTKVRYLNQREGFRRAVWER